MQFYGESGTLKRGQLYRVRKEEKSPQLSTGTVIGHDIRFKLLLLSSPAFRPISGDVIDNLAISITRNPRVRVQAIHAAYSHPGKTDEADPSDLQPSAEIYDKSDLKSNAAVYDSTSKPAVHIKSPDPLNIKDQPEDDGRSVFTLEGIRELEMLIMTARKWDSNADALVPYENPMDPKIANNPLALAWIINPELIFEVIKTKVKIPDCAEALTRIDIIVGQKNDKGVPDTIHKTLTLHTKFDSPENIARMKRGNSLQEFIFYNPVQENQEHVTMPLRRMLKLVA